MPTKTLRAVAPGETIRRKKPLGISAAADGGDRRELLVALRSRIAKSIENPNTLARDLAALSRRLLEIANDIEAIDSKDGDDQIGNAASTPDEDWNGEAL